MSHPDSHPDLHSGPHPGAPACLAEACLTFEADVEEPGLCAGCGWLEEEHPAAIEPTTPIAA